MWLPLESVIEARIYRMNLAPSGPQRDGIERLDLSGVAKNVVCDRYVVSLQLLELQQLGDARPAAIHDLRVSVLAV